MVLDDPRQHQLLKGLVPGTGHTEAQHVVAAGQPIEPRSTPWPRSPLAAEGKKYPQAVKVFDATTSTVPRHCT
jgi:hypothetical protein